MTSDEWHDETDISRGIYAALVELVTRSVRLAPRRRISGPRTKLRLRRLDAFATNHASGATTRLAPRLGTTCPACRQSSLAGNFTTPLSKKTASCNDASLALSVVDCSRSTLAQTKPAPQFPSTGKPYKSLLSPTASGLGNGWFMDPPTAALSTAERSVSRSLTMWVISATNALARFYSRACWRAREASPLEGIWRSGKPVASRTWNSVRPPGMAHGL